jgi:hypothetical protein
MEVGLAVLYIAYLAVNVGYVRRAESRRRTGREARPDPWEFGKLLHEVRSPWATA